MTANKIFFVSLGCDKNRVDSEEMLGYLSDAGFSFTYDEREADIIVVNTCAFIDPAKEESIETILEMAEHKKNGSLKGLIVTGCLAERYSEDILDELPEIDAVLGVYEISKIAETAIDLVKEKALNNTDFMTDYSIPGIRPKRIFTTPGYYEFLKIAEGCNKRCTYCAIPLIRGPYKSFDMDRLIEEARYLASSDIKELIVVAQETTVYGRDLYGKDMLSELLKRLSDISGFEWIRLLYAYPEDISDELLNLIADNNKIVHYIDMPIQHSSDRILKRMGRRTTRDELEDVINRARDIIPDVCLRTSLISGFPGETEDDHLELKDFINKMKFDHLGVFEYSREEGTPAYSFDGQVDKKTIERRRNELMALQKEISSDKLSLNIGKTFDVLIEGMLEDDNVYAGRTYMDAPEVDGCFFVKTERNLMSGDFVSATVTKTGEYDMIGEIKE